MAPARKTKPEVQSAEDIAADAKPTDSPVATKGPRADTKHAKVLGLLARPEGATIADLAEATGWQTHTVRGALSGMITKKLGQTVVSEKVPDRGRVYRITQPQT
jgi:predicted ArsR family transcriptional regulator